LTVYQYLTAVGLAPDDCIGRPIITLWQSPSGSLAFDIEGVILVAEGEGPWKFVRALELDGEFLFATPREILWAYRKAIDAAERRGIDWKGEN
jgi:hypothetical protein